MKKELFAFLSIKLIPAGVNFLLIPLLFRVFGPEVYGQFSLAQSLAMLFVTVFTGFFIHSIYRYFSQEDVNKYYSLAVVVSCFSFVLAVLIFSFLDVTLVIFNFMVALFISVSCCYTLLLIVVQLIGSKASLAMLEFLRIVSLLVFLGVISYVKVDFAIDSYISLILCTYFLSYMLPLVFILVKFPHLKLVKFEWGWVLKHIKFGAKIACWLILVTFYWYFAKLFVEHNYSAEQLGTFSALFDLVYKVVSLIGSAFTMYLYPKVSELTEQKNVKAILAVINKALSYYFFVSLGILILSLLIGPFVLYIVLKENYTFGIIAAITCPLLIIQASVVLQKPLEVAGLMWWLLLGMLISIASTLLVLLLLFNDITDFKVLFGYGYTSGSVIYFVFVLVLLKYSPIWHKREV